MSSNASAAPCPRADDVTLCSRLPFSTLTRIVNNELMFELKFELKFELMILYFLESPVKSLTCFYFLSACAAPE